MIIIRNIKVSLDWDFTNIKKLFCKVLNVSLESDAQVKLYKKAIAITSKQKSSLLDCAVSYVNLAHLYEEKETVS